MKWQQHNPEKMITKQREYRQRKPQAHRAANSRYRQLNRDYYRKLNAIVAKTRRKRKYENGGKFTVNDLRLKLFNQFGCCWWCGCTLGPVWHPDHVIPIARGGRNDASNIVISCPACNLSKNASMPDEYLRRASVQQWMKTIRQ